MNFFKFTSFVSMLVLLVIFSTSAFALTYTTRAGDSLWDITDHFTNGKPLEWSKLYKINQCVIGSEPDDIQIGIKLTIPREWYIFTQGESLPLYLQDYFYTRYSNSWPMAYYQEKKYLGTLTFEDQMWFFWWQRYPNNPQMVKILTKHYLTPEGQKELQSLIQKGQKNN